MKNTSAIQSNFIIKGQEKSKNLKSLFKKIKDYFLGLNPFDLKQQCTLLTGELHKKEQEIARLKWDLLQKKEQVRDISFHQSHMVRRPLANILGVIELMNTNQTELGEAEMQELITLLKKSADALDKTIRQNSASTT